MLSHTLYAVSTVVALVIASVVTQIHPQSDNALVEAAADLVQRAMQWRETAVQDTDPALRLQHAASALAYMQAARSLARDGSIERRLGIDVARLSRSMERRVQEARQICRPANPSIVE